jgi:hypothetical protein
VSNPPPDRDRRPVRRPTHPRMKAFLLMVGVVAAIVALAAISTFGSH